ncbi:MAG: hypothetical protein ACD_73C00680G0001, partial [uncultured bacterium]
KIFYLITNPSPPTAIDTPPKAPCINFIGFDKKRLRKKMGFLTFFIGDEDFGLHDEIKLTPVISFGFLILSISRIVGAISQRRPPCGFK